MKITKILSTVLLTTLCACNGFIGSATPPPSAIEINNSSTSETIAPPHLEHDAIYFWWWDGNKGVHQLWELSPQGIPNILYDFTSTQSPEDAINTGLLPESYLITPEHKIVGSVPNLMLNGEIALLPDSLQLSPDRRRISWGEEFYYYCAKANAKSCIAGSIIRIFNLENRKLETSISIPVEHHASAPVWSPDSKKLAYYTKQYENDTVHVTIHIYDINTTETIDIEGTDNDYQRSKWLTWLPDSSGIIMGNSSGLYLFTLNSRETEHIFVIENWYVFDIVISPNGNLIAFTGIENTDGSTNPYALDFKMSSGQFIHIFDLKTRTSQSVIKKNKQGWIYSLYWLPDGEHIIYTHHQSLPLHSEIFIHDLISNEIAMTKILPFDSSLWAKSTQLSQDGKKMLFVSSKYQRSTASSRESLMIFNLGTKTWIEVPLPAEIQNMMDKNMQNYSLGSIVW